MKFSSSYNSCIIMLLIILFELALITQTACQVHSNLQAMYKHLIINEDGLVTLI